MKNGAEQGTGQLTDYERVKMENFALKHTAMQQKMNENLMERGAFIQTIEAAHPGYQWRDPNGLEPIPTEQPAADPGASKRTAARN